MQPVVKRVLVHGGLAAGILAFLGLFFAELTITGTAGTVRPGSANLNPPLPDSLRYRVPLTMAGAGFLFVAVGELLASRFRRPAPAPKPADPQHDDAERLLNELLAQAESKMALERGQGSGVRGQEEGEKTEQKPEDGGPKPPAPPV